MTRFRLGCSGTRAPLVCNRFKVARFNYEGIVVPMCSRITIPLRDSVTDMWRTANRDHPGVVNHFAEDNDVVWRVKEHLAVVVRRWHHDAVGAS